LGAPADISQQDFGAEAFRRRAEARLLREQPLFDLAAGTHGGDHTLWSRKMPLEALAQAKGAAVLIPIVAHKDEATVLLTQRASSLRNHSGQIAFPGGRIDGGESAVQAALREAEEEIGLTVSHIEPIGHMDYYFTGTGYRISPVVAIVTPPFNLTLNAQEVDSVFEVPLSFLMQPANHQRITRKEDGRSFYAMPFGERYIWGATAGMLRGLYESLYR
jgi:mutator protein MutT